MQSCIVINGYHRRRECLRHFVVILTELRQLKLLCNLTYPGMEEDVRVAVAVCVSVCFVLHALLEPSYMYMYTVYISVKSPRGTKFPLVYMYNVM